jgi:hypothetical protein
MRSPVPMPPGRSRYSTRATLARSIVSSLPAILILMPVASSALISPVFFVPSARITVWGAAPWARTPVGEATTTTEASRTGNRNRMDVRTSPVTRR